MADSAMMPADVAQQSADQREQVPVAVIAGPAGPGVPDERVTGRLRQVLAGPQLIGRAQAEAGHVDGRRRVLTDAVANTPGNAPPRPVSPRVPARPRRGWSKAPEYRAGNRP